MLEGQTSAEEGRASKYANAWAVKTVLHNYVILAAAATALRIVTGWALF